MNYIKFDLKTALRHPERVVLRDGRRITEIHHFKTAKEYCRVYAVIDGDPYAFYEDGSLFPEVANVSDLFLLPE